MRTILAAFVVAVGLTPEHREELLEHRSLTDEYITNRFASGDPPRIANALRKLVEQGCRPGDGDIVASLVALFEGGDRLRCVVYERRLETGDLAGDLFTVRVRQASAAAAFAAEALGDEEVDLYAVVVFPDAGLRG